MRRGGIGPWAVWTSSASAFAGAYAHVHVLILDFVHAVVLGLDLTPFKMAELGKGGPKGPEACAVQVDKLSLGQCTVAGIGGLQELPDACLVAGGRRFGKMIPQVGQEVVDLRPSGGAANHEAGGEELVIRPLAACGQFLDLVEACRARRAVLLERRGIGDGVKVVG